MMIGIFGDSGFAAVAASPHFGRLPGAALASELAPGFYEDRQGLSLFFPGVSRWSAGKIPGDHDNFRGSLRKLLGGRNFFEHYLDTLPFAHFSPGVMEKAVLFLYAILAFCRGT